MRKLVGGGLLGLGVLGALTSRGVAQVPDTAPGLQVLLRRDFAAAIPQLGRSISVRLEGASLDEALRMVADQAGLPMPGTVTGRVTDATSAEPLVGAAVYLEGTRWRTATAEDGRFRLAEIPPGSYTLVARRIGYAAGRQEVTVGEGEAVEVAIALTPQATMLDEVVTTVTGAQERYKIGNAIARIDAESLTVSAPVRGLTDLLTARAAGVQVLAANGVTGQAPRIRVRGLNSFSVTNDPIVIIDGVRVENSPGSNVFNGFTSTSPFLSGRLSDLNPDEIESIDIVKGPSAATLYGTDAANGVLVITTRKGRAGPPAYRLYAEQGVLEPDPASPFPANRYAFGHNTGTGAAQQCLLSQVAAGTCVQDSVGTFNPMYQSVSAPLGTGYRGVYGAQVSGGVSQFTYFLSGEYEQETGYLRMADVDQQFLAQLRGAPVLPEQVRPNAVSKVSLRGNVGTTLGSRADIALSTGLHSVGHRRRLGPRDPGHRRRGDRRGVAWAAAGQHLRAGQPGSGHALHRRHRRQLSPLLLARGSRNAGRGFFQ